MKQRRNSRSAYDLFAGFDQLIREYAIERPRAQWHALRAKFENLAGTNFALGAEFAGRGQWFDAALRFRFVIYLQPNFAPAHYSLGHCYMQMGKRDKAAQYFRSALRLDPAHRAARFMLSGVQPGSMSADQLPKTMPGELVVGFFTQVAPDYDRLAELNQYQGGRIVAEACHPFLKKANDLHLIDLGCGTGLVAKPWRALCREVLGVDVTPAMVAAAQVARSGDNPTYDRVLKEDINAVAAGTFMPGASDVVLCIDTAQFLGDLAPLFKLASQSLGQDGLFVLSMEPFKAPHGFGVNPASGRFGHALEYVRRLAATHGLENKRDVAVSLYAGLNNHLFVFSKAA